MNGRSAPSVVVIGAGMAGLTAARDLTQAGASVTVLDKGRGVGGRLATRRVGGAVLDHGAQFFTARSPLFAAEVTGWLASGVAVGWFTGILGAEGIVGDDTEMRYRATAGMTGIAKHIAAGLNVRVATPVRSVEANDGRWTTHLHEGGHLDADAMVLTAPAPQTLAMLDPDGLDPVDRLDLERITYDPCLAVLAVLDRSPGIGTPGARRPSAEPLGWFADNQAKGISEVPALTVHAGPQTSRELWDSNDDEVIAALLHPLDLNGAGVLDAQVQRWRYAQATTAHTEPCLVLRSDAPGVVAGDAFGEGGRIEGAALSGMAAAAALAERLGIG